MLEIPLKGATAKFFLMLQILNHYVTASSALGASASLVSFVPSSDSYEKLSRGSTPLDSDTLVRPRQSSKNSVLFQPTKCHLSYFQIKLLYLRLYKFAFVVFQVILVPIAPKCCNSIANSIKPIDTFEALL